METAKFADVGCSAGGTMCPHFFQMAISPWKKGSGGSKFPDFSFTLWHKQFSFCQPGTYWATTGPVNWFVFTMKVSKNHHSHLKEFMYLGQPLFHNIKTILNVNSDVYVCTMCINLYTISNSCQCLLILEGDALFSVNMAHQKNMENRFIYLLLGMVHSFTYRSW